MEDSEKMTALKKAYAEIILNTAKEAAARIMVSERKANQFHHDLSSTKEEALRLLLRLKQTMDSQLKEADMKSLHQQRRIEELEAQLQEAEDIVSNLRAELNEAHMKLEEMEKNHGAKVMGKGDCEEEKAELENIMPKEMSEHENIMSKSVLASPIKVLTDAANVRLNSSLGQQGYAGVPDVPSIIVRNKERELYRNGCTQRIRAYEGNLLNGRFSVSGALEDVKNEKAVVEDKEVEKIDTSSLSSDHMCNVGKKPIDIKEVRNVDKSIIRSQSSKSFRRKRKRAARCRRSNASVLKPVSLCGSHDLLESLKVEDKDTLLHSPSTVPSNVSDIGSLSEHAIVVEGDSDIVGPHNNAMDEDREVASSLVLIRQQSGTGVGLDVPTSNPELEKRNASSVYLDAKELEKGELFPSPPPKDRVLKYTFQRKRKKESLSSDDGSLVQQESFLKRHVDNKQNGSLEPPISTTAAESSRDSRRMAQVARQLISLSEKKWWK